MKLFIRRSLILAFFTLAANGMTVAAEEKSSKKEEIVTVVTKQTYAPDAKEFTFNFIVKPLDGHIIVPEGHWKITINEANHLSFATQADQAIAYTSNLFDEKIPGFQVKAKVGDGHKAGSFSYEVRAFVCKEDKSQCFPRTVKGETNWKI